MVNETYPRLLGDIGGTDARFAWRVERTAPPADVACCACADDDSLLAAILQYLADQRKACPPACALGIANPSLGDAVQMTHHHWSFSIPQLQRSLGLQRLKVINDFTAQALSLPTLQAADLLRLGPAGHAVAGAPLAVLDVLAQRFGHASAERALSGPGLVNRYVAACTLAARQSLLPGPADVIDAQVSPALAGAARALDIVD